MTRLVGVVKGPTLIAAKEQIARGSADADLLEIRLDLFEPKALTHLNELPRTRPLIFAFRKKAQGGGRDLSEQDRLPLFEKCLSSRPDYCDIEADSDIGFFQKVHELYPKMQIIASWHDFEKMPANFTETLEKMDRPHAAIYKLAALARSPNDALRMLAFAKEKKNVVCIALGSDGEISRILGPLVHSELVYASIEEADAPMGQLSLKTLCDLYRFKTLTEQTKIYALLGDPVDKSQDHLFHNRSFPPDAVYVKLHMPIPDLPFFFSIMRKFPFGGFSVAMPLKEQLDNFLTRIDPAAAAIGSVNTVKVEDEHLLGYNTDGAGALDAIEERRPVKGLTIALLGAGGSARAIAYEALERQAKVIVLNRTLERAQVLAKDFGCEAVPLEEFSRISYDILVNTVPVDLIFDPASLHPSSIVMDIVYWEAETPLLKAARERGCTCIGGQQMFEKQARLQQKIWFGS